MQVHKISNPKVKQTLHETRYSIAAALHCVINCIMAYRRQRCHAFLFTLKGDVLAAENRFFPEVLAQIMSANRKRWNARRHKASRKQRPTTKIFAKTLRARWFSLGMTIMNNLHQAGHSCHSFRAIGKVVIVRMASHGPA